jgi:8-oxo-dGTP pyrophosphatase MutT (NUDIX family)
MQQFSNLKPENEITPKKKNTLFSNDYVSVIDYEDWSIIDESDMVVCIIYLIEQNQFILRNEYIPTFKYIDGQEYHITVLSGTVKKGESYKTALLREIEEEAGIVISPEFNIEFMKPLFVSKGNTAKYHPSIITLTERDYHEVIAKGDGSKAEKKSQTVKVDIKYINAVNPSDLITEYMITKFKDYLNM